MDVSRAFSILALTAALFEGTAACGHAERAPAPTATPTASPAQTASPTAAGPTPSSSPSIPVFKAKITEVTASQLKYSWRSGCPVPPSGLRMITMPYWGFDKQPHEGGQLVVNAAVAKQVAGVFGKLYAARYPIREMAPVDKYKGSDYDSIDADNTSAFNCRPATGSSNWSRHAYGMAVDLNPCENPYVDTSGTIYHKKCEKYYKNRSAREPGVIVGGDKVVRAFQSMGWKWGGYWPGTKDYQHFSDSR